MTYVGNDSYVWFDGFSNHLRPRRPTSSCTELVIYNRMVISLCFHVVNVLLQQS
jgi:hypothetical protein